MRLSVGSQGTDWQWCGVAVCSGKTEAEHLRHGGSTIASLPLDAKVGI